MSSRKQSVLLGGLISSAGIFISKLLGLLYVVPFDTILGSAANRAYYGQSYTIYSYILNIATAGLPFAIATMIAKYSSREDYRTCLLVKKISFYTMAAFGFICMLAVILFSDTIATQICPLNGNVETMKSVIIVISLALFIIPILSSLRGFYQGLKELQLYSASQVLEQLARIIFLMGMGSLFVYVFKQDNIWALYFGVISASVSGVVAILYMRIKGNDAFVEIKTKAARQELKTEADPKELFRELLFLSIPFLLQSVFGFCDSMINMFDLKPGLNAYAGDLKFSAVLSDAIFYKTTKVIAIPMILAPGFSAAIIPYITSSLEKKDIKQVKKYILDCIETVIYIAIPLCFSLFAFATPVMYILFGSENIELYSYVLQWFSLEAFCATVCPIFASISMALGYRKESVFCSFLFGVVKLLLNRLFISFFGLGGMVLSSVVAYIVFTAFNIILVQRSYHINWKYTLRKIALMLVALIPYILVYFVFDMIGWNTYIDSKVMAFIYLGIMGIGTCGAYFGFTLFCSIPQSIFHFNVDNILNKIRGRFS